MIVYGKDINPKVRNVLFELNGMDLVAIFRRVDITEKSWLLEIIQILVFQLKRY